VPEETLCDWGCFEGKSNNARRDENRCAILVDPHKPALS
jgi:hypothetical protein